MEKKIHKYICFLVFLFSQCCSLGVLLLSLDMTLQNTTKLYSQFMGNYTSQFIVNTVGDKIILMTSLNITAKFI